MKFRIKLIVLCLTIVKGSYSQSIDCKIISSLVDFAVKNEWIQKKYHTKIKVITCTSLTPKFETGCKLKKAAYILEPNTNQKLYINNIRVNEFDIRDEAYYFKIETVLFGTVTSRNVLISNKSPYKIIQESVNFFWNE